MSEAVVIGVDLGSSGARVVAVSSEGRMKAWAHEPFPESRSWPSGRADPGVWLAGLERALRSIMQIDADIMAIAVGGQSPTTVPMDGGLAVTCRHPAGSGLSRQEQHSAQRDFLEAELGGTIRPAQIWDWALRKLGTNEMQGLWPEENPLEGYGEPVEVGDVIGHSDGSLGTKIGTPLASGSNDAYMSFWAGGLAIPGQGYDPGGRTGGIGVALAANERPRELFGFPSAVTGVEIVGGPVNGHGDLLDWWARITGKSIQELIMEAELVPPGAAGVFVLPYHDGERAPRWEPRLRGQIHNLNFETGASEVARAVLESTAYGLKHIHEGLQQAGVRMDSLTCGGSPAKSRLWCSIKASVLEVPVDVLAYPDRASSFGCALAAGAAIGWWDGLGADNVDSWPLLEKSRIEPQPSDTYRDGYERFVAAGDAAVAQLATSGPRGIVP